MTELGGNYFFYLYLRKHSLFLIESKILHPSRVVLEVPFHQVDLEDLVILVHQVLLAVLGNLAGRAGLGDLYIKSIFFS